MTVSNVQLSRGVTLVGDGGPTESDIRFLLKFAPELVAVDGGANACAAFSLSPVAVVGDFDSVSADTKSVLGTTRFLHIAEQDSTDFEKALAHIDAPFFLATGFTGQRLDHTLAVFSALAQHQGPPVLLLGERDVIFAAPPKITLPLQAGTRVSLFPMTAVRGTSTGLKWPIEGLAFHPFGQIGTSNEATGPVSLEFDTRGCLIILPRAALEVAREALIG